MNARLETRVCGRCGRRLDSFSPDGLCQTCLLQDALACGGGAPPAPPPAAESLPSGSSARRFGDYELLEEVARGGMGVVWKARQLTLNRCVALKLMLAGPFAGANFVRRFRAEAEAAASLQHPNIVAIHEVGEEEGQPFFSMDYVEGMDLAALVRDQPLPARRAAGYLKVIAEAVHYAHQQGVLHRDLKPSNILIDQADQPRITDFGLAKRFVAETIGLSSSARARPSEARGDVVEGAAPTLEWTLTGQVLGSPNYLPPEQAEGRLRDIGPASDVYALGAILFHLLASRPPFQAATVTEMLQQVSRAEPVSLKLLNPSVPRDLETICLKCLEKEIPRRYASAQALADELGRFLRNEPIQARPVGTLGRTWRWCRRNPRVAILTAALVLVFFSGFAGVSWQWRRAQHHAKASEEALGRANYERARAWRMSGQMGQRVQALAAIRHAAALRPSAELRTEAVGALALTDLEDSGEWHPLPAEARAFDIAASGERFAVLGSNGCLEVRRFTDGALLAARTNQVSYPTLRLNPDGSSLALCGEERSFVWDTLADRVLWEVNGRRMVTFSPVGKRCVRSTTRGGVAVFDLETGKETVHLDQALQPRLALFSPQGNRIAVTDGSSLEVWSLTTLQREATTRFSAGVEKFVWHPDGEILVVGCDDHTVQLWGWADGRLQKLRGHLREGMSPFIHPSGDLLASTAFDNTLLLWDPHFDVPLLKTSGMSILGFSTDGQWLFVLGQRGLGRLRIHRPAECRLLHTEIAGNQAMERLDFSPDGRWLAGHNWNGPLWLWQAGSDQPPAKHPLRTCEAVQFLDPNSILTVSPDGVQIWTNRGAAHEWRPGPPLTLVPPAGWMHSASLSSDRRLFAMGWDGQHGVFDLVPSPQGPTPSEQTGQTGPAAPRTSLPASATLRFRLRGQPFSSCPSISPDGQWIATGCWNNAGDFGSALWLWSARDGQPVHQIPFGNCLARFSPDGRWFLATGSREYRLYAVEGPPHRWRELWREPRSSPGIVAGEAQFASHRSWVAVMADERVIRLLEVASRRELARLTPLAPDIGAVAWSADGRWLAAASGFGTHLWDLPLLREQLRKLNLDWNDPDPPPQETRTQP